MGIANFLLNKEEGFNEAKESSVEKYIELFSKVKGYKPELQNVTDNVINNMLTIYVREFDLKKDEVDPADFADWISDSGSYGEFIFEFRNELATKNIEELGSLDPRFIRAITIYAKENGYIDEEGRDTSIRGEKGRVLNAKQLMRSIFDDACRSSTPGEKVANIDHFDDTLFNDTLDAIEEIYRENGINEEVVEDVTPVEIDTGSVPPTIEVPVEAVEEKPSDDVVIAAHNDIINQLINDSWNFISSVNSAIATIEYDFPGNKEEVIRLLNEVVDATTINIGILHGASNLIDKDTADLIAAGEAKATETINN